MIQQLEGKNESKPNEIRDLCNEIESLLLFGPEEEVTGKVKEGPDRRAQILTSIADCHTKFQSLHHLQEELNEKLVKAKEEINHQHSTILQYHEEQVLPKYEQYLQTQYKLQLYSLMKVLKQLENETNIEKIPSIILTIPSKIPKVLHARSKMKDMISLIIDRKKLKIIETFKQFFENHFQKIQNQQEEDQKKEDPGVSSVSVSSSSSSSNDMGNWEDFLRQSRHWLLVYTLLSILPAILLQQSSNSILEAFKESLDIALTPLWGRFYYHLSLSIEIKSRKQILWTFYYTKSFIEMLFNLIIQITLNQQVLKVLYSNINYLQAAEDQIIEKSMKFLKAHIASILVIEVLPSVSSGKLGGGWDREFGIQIIEEVLELDQWLSSYIRSSPSNLVSSSSETGLQESRGYYQGMCEVIYDCKDVFHHWMLEERKLVFEKLQQYTTNDDTSFSLCLPSTNFLFDTDDVIPLVSSKNKLNNTLRASDNDESSSSASLRCYNSIYHSLSLFILLRQRYSFFPLNAQILLSEIILEPLLCYTLSLLLYRIRNHKLLYQISINTFMNKYPNNIDIHEYYLFQSTVNYLVTSLQQSSIECMELGRIMIGNSFRCKKKWTILQNWIPKILITREQQEAGFTIDHLLKMSFKLPEKYTVMTAQGQYQYRQVNQHPLMRVLQTKGNLSDYVPTVEGGDDNLEDSVTLIAELARTLVNVLSNHFNE